MQLRLLCLADWSVTSWRERSHFLRCLSSTPYAGKEPLRLYNSSVSVHSSRSNPELSAQNIHISLCKRSPFFSPSTLLAPFLPFISNIPKKITKTEHFRTAHIYCRAHSDLCSLHQPKITEMFASIRMSILLFNSFALHTSHNVPFSRLLISAVNWNGTNHSTHSLLYPSSNRLFTHLHTPTGIQYTLATSYSKPLLLPHRQFVTSFTCAFQSVLYSYRYPFISNDNLSLII